MNKRLMILFFVLVLSLDGHSDDVGEPDIKVAIPPELDPLPTKEEMAREKEYSDLRLRASVGLPYQNMNDKIKNRAFFTLGNAVKQCTNIAIISVQSSESLPFTDRLRVLRLRFNVESNLLESADFSLRFCRVSA